MGRAGASWRLLGGRESLRAEHHAPGGLVRAVSHLRPDGGPRLVAGPSRSSATGQPDGSPSRCDYQGGPPARAHLRLPLPSYRGRCVAPENPSRRPAHHAPTQPLIKTPALPAGPAESCASSCESAALPPPWPSAPPWSTRTDPWQSSAASAQQVFGRLGRTCQSPSRSAAESVQLAHESLYPPSQTLGGPAAVSVVTANARGIRALPMLAGGPQSSDAQPRHVSRDMARSDSWFR